MKKRDIILIGVLLVIAIGSFIAYRLMWIQEPGVNGQVLVTIDGKEYGRYPLYKNQTIQITGEGVNVIQIQDGYVEMINADCPDQICVNHASIHYEREMIVCMPNEVVVEVIDSEIGGVDAVAQ